MIAEIHREGKIWKQTFHRGIPEAPVAVVGEAFDTGTTITFLPDKTIFTETVYNYDTLASRLRELAYLNKGIRLTIMDKRNIDPESGLAKCEVFYSEVGLGEFVEYIDGTREKLIDNTITLSTEKAGIPIEVAVHYNKEYSENVFSYVNNINTIEGGTHLDGFKRALRATLKRYADNSGLLAKAKVEVSADDFREGLTAVISVLRISVSRTTAVFLVLGMVQPIAIVLIFSVFLSSFLAHHMAKRVVEPLNCLDLKNPMENDTYEELSPLLHRSRHRRSQASHETRQKIKIHYTRKVKHMATGSIRIKKTKNGEKKLIQ